MGFGDVEQLLQGCLELCRVLVVLVVFYEGLIGYRSYAGRFKDLKLKVLRACSQYVEVPLGGRGGKEHLLMCTKHFSLGMMTQT